MDLITLDEAKAQENISSSADDEELQTYIDAVTAFITRKGGDVISRTYTEVHNGGKTTLILDHSPVLSVTSITEYVGLTGYPLTLQPLGSTTSNYGYSIDNPDAGIITRRSSVCTPLRFLGGPGSVSVTYVAGRALNDFDLPAIKLAGLIVLEHLWATQRGSSTGRPLPGVEQDMGAVIPAGYAMPNRAAELLDGQRAPAVA